MLNNKNIVTSSHNLKLRKSKSTLRQFRNLQSNNIRFSVKARAGHAHHIVQKQPPEVFCKKRCS